MEHIVKLPKFVTAEDWTSGISDLNSLDNRLWDVLEDIACLKSRKNIHGLKAYKKRIKI